MLHMRRMKTVDYFARSEVEDNSLNDSHAIFSSLCDKNCFFFFYNFSVTLQRLPNRAVCAVCSGAK